MIHENDRGRIDLSPDYLTLCNRYFIRETSLQFWVKHFLESHLILLDVMNYGFLTTETNSNALYIFHGFHHLISKAILKENPSSY